MTADENKTIEDVCERITAEHLSLPKEQEQCLANIKKNMIFKYNLKQLNKKEPTLSQINGILNAGIVHV